MTNRPHALYRFYDPDGQLLYVGITCDPGARWRQHRDDKAWWTDVANITLETHPTREAVLDAERAAILAEHPRHNVVHNRGGRAKTAPSPSPCAHRSYESTTNQWNFESRRGFARTSDLYLSWEVEGTAMSDDWTPDDITAQELLLLWLRRYGAAHVPIYWSISPLHETAPFQPNNPWPGRDFLSYYTWPEHATTGEPLNFNRLPVLDKGWDDEHYDKGGFFQQATGWKPAPMQGHVDLRAVMRAAHLGGTR